MAEMTRDEIRQKLDGVQTKITGLERDKAQLEVKRDNFQEKVNELRPQVEEIFGTTDSEELAAKRSELLAKLDSLDLNV